MHPTSSSQIPHLYIFISRALDGNCIYLPQFAELKNAFKVLNQRFEFAKSNSLSHQRGINHALGALAHFSK
jgi:hypothetical protein